MSSYSGYLLVAVPNGDGRDATYDALRSRIVELATVFKFDLPTDLKVGTLDALMQLSDDLAKADMVCESTVGKLVGALATLLDRNMEKLESNLTANGIDSAGVLYVANNGSGPLDKYLESFQWNEAKYPIKNSIRDLADNLQKQIGQIDNELKLKLTDYNNLRQNVNNAERKQTGNLLVRSLVDLVSKDDFVLDSEYLVTLLVVVPKFAYKDWFATYEKGITDFVVPRSSRLVSEKTDFLRRGARKETIKTACRILRKVTEDSEYGLFNVTVFKRVAADFKTAARERKFIVRDFEYDEKLIDAERQERSELSEKLKKQLANILRWTKTNLSEAFVAWIHLKALRVHTESILSYGLPVNYRSMVVKFTKKNEKRIRDSLQQLYGHLGRADAAGDDTAAAAAVAAIIPGQIGGEYFPYVSYPVNLEFIK